MKRRWFLFFLGKSLSQRKGRVIIASLSVTLSVAVITGMMGITAGIGEKLGTELKSYGANIVVSAQKGGYLRYDTAGIIAKINNVEEAAGQIFGNAVIERQSLEVIGLDISKVRERGWRLTGKWPEKKAEMLVGINLKNALMLETGKTVQLSNGERSMNFVVSGFIEKGGPEDSALIMAIEDAQEMLGLDGKLSAVLVRGRSGQLEGIVKDIRNAFPEAQVKTLRQVAFAEESLLKKIQLLMAFVTVVVLLATAISVASTMGANVLERREEIGLMKAIGATKKEIGLFYKAEAVLIGCSGGIAGFMLGYLTAQAVSKGAFNSFISMPFYLSFFSIVIGLLISLLASHFPVKDAMKYNPAIILRGE